MKLSYFARHIKSGISGSGAIHHSRALITVADDVTTSSSLPQRMAYKNVSFNVSQWNRSLDMWFKQGQVAIIYICFSQPNRNAMLRMRTDRYFWIPTTRVSVLKLGRIFALAPYFYRFIHFWRRSVRDTVVQRNDHWLAKMLLAQREINVHKTELLYL